MIIVGYERVLAEEPYCEYVESARFAEKSDAEAAMLELRRSQVGNDDILLFFYGVAISDTEFEVSLILDVDTPLPPDEPEVTE